MITDEALANNSDYAQVWEAALQYVREGGTCVIMGDFSSFVKPLLVKQFFAKAGLWWDTGSYRRATLALKPSIMGPDLAVKLPRRYGPKALNVQNVAHGDIWYHTDEISAVKDLGLDDIGETPVAFARIGNGRLGYVGDVNAEEDSGTIILAMCGVL
ncbi:hypothetical protein B0T24DRAFT_632538 [Lasiosphaeria ovina]|uniref:Uncharacterized protein n=1 Tax=Lasiosphaeria ovina TaxID=92902 RepID=A0AAE0N3I0_9PEZI|nr:hypothetical protein B0T24DRAFT_632538 [Lasiosphaeria ovina]